MSCDRPESAEPEALAWLAILEFLCRSARRRLAGTVVVGLADDLAHEALLRTLEAARTKKVDRRRAYAHGILRHLCADALAAVKRRARPISHGCAEVPLAGTQQQGEPVLAWFRGPFVDRLARTLTDRQRRVLEVLLRARSFNAAAEELGMDGRDVREVFLQIVKKGRRLRETYPGEADE